MKRMILSLLFLVCFFAFFFVFKSPGSQPKLEAAVPAAEIPAPVQQVNNEVISPYPLVTSKAESGLFYLEIPKLNIHHFWVQQGVGDEQEQLSVGGSLLQSTPLPSSDASANQNSVVGAHRTGYGNSFYNIDKLNPGDIMEVHLRGHVFIYSVQKSFIIQETAGYQEAVGATGENTLTIYSCDDGKGGPGALGTQYRYVVRAVLVSTSANA
jgi:LPXTG-site transpeptidase (sortase) family protein